MTVNSITEIQKRVAATKITWARPLTLLAARSVLAVICQALVTAVFCCCSENNLVTPSLAVTGFEPFPPSVSPTDE
jgi:hypothetical protein